MKSTLSHITLSAAAHRAQGVTPDEKRRSARPSHAVVRALSMTMGAIGLLAGSPAQGGDSFWTSSANGTFSDPGNWSPGVPGALDRANFDNNATYTVSWSADAINAEARYNASGGGELTWSVGGANTWRLTDRLVVGQDAASFGTVWHTSGTIAVTNTSGTGELVIRENAGFAGFSLRDGTLIADRITAPNGGFTWNFFGGTLTTTKGVDVGAGGSTVDFVLGSGYYGPHAAVWNVAGGTNIIDIGTGRFRIGHNNAQGTSRESATLNITGSGTVMTNSGRFFVGADNSLSNSLVVSNGAALYCMSPNDTIIGTTASLGNSTGVVTGTNSLWAMQNSGFIVGYAPSNTLIVSAGGRLTVASYAGLGWTGGACRGLVTGMDSWWDVGGTMTIGFGAGSSSNLLTVAAGGTVRANDLVLGDDLANSGNSLTVSNGNLYVTNGVSTATLEVRNGVLTVAGSSGNVNADTLTVANGSTLKFVADAAGVTRVTVDDTFTLDATAKLDVDLTGYGSAGASQELVLVEYGSKSGSFAPGNITVNSPFETILGQDDDGRITLRRIVDLLAISNARTEGESGLVLTWYSVSNNQYAVSGGSNLVGSWSMVATNILATPPLNVETVTVETATGFYRIELE